MSYAINTNTVTLADWQKSNSDIDVEYRLREDEPGAITLMTGGTNSEEMLRIDQTGFYVRGTRVPADEHEALTVYNAFKQWLAWANLQRQ